jgi:hypothetical protein
MIIGVNLALLELLWLLGGVLLELLVLLGWQVLYELS